MSLQSSPHQLSIQQFCVFGLEIKFAVLTLEALLPHEVGMAKASPQEKKALGPSLEEPSYLLLHGSTCMRLILCKSASSGGRLWCINCLRSVAFTAIARR